MINQTFHRIRLNYYKTVLDSLPTGSVKFHRGRKVVRLYYKNPKKILEHAVSTAKGQEFMGILEYRNKIESLKSKYEILWESLYKEHFAYDDFTVMNNNKLALISSSSWEKLQQAVKGEEYKKDSEYPNTHNNIKMRSRFEIMTAEVLDELDLEYLYEVKFIINENVYYADFVVRVPELGLCIVIECLGMMDSKKYRKRLVDKFEDYTDIGMLPGRDIIFISSTDKYLPDSKQIKSLIAGQLETLSYTLIK